MLTIIYKQAAPTGAKKCGSALIYKQAACTEAKRYGHALICKQAARTAVDASEHSPYKQIASC